MNNTYDVDQEEEVVNDPLIPSMTQKRMNSIQFR